MMAAREEGVLGDEGLGDREYVHLCPVTPSFLDAADH